jgi:hypothetical protein
MRLCLLVFQPEPGRPQPNLSASTLVVFAEPGAAVGPQAVGNWRSTSDTRGTSIRRCAVVL